MTQFFTRFVTRQKSSEKSSRVASDCKVDLITVYHIVLSDPARPDGRFVLCPSSTEITQSINLFWEVLFLTISLVSI